MAKRQRPKAKKYDKNCVVCGKPFVGYARTKTCGPSCSEENKIGYKRRSDYDMNTIHFPFKSGRTKTCLRNGKQCKHYDFCLAASDREWAPQYGCKNGDGFVGAGSFLTCDPSLHRARVIASTRI